MTSLRTVLKSYNLHFSGCTHGSLVFALPNSTLSIAEEESGVGTSNMLQSFRGMDVNKLK